MLSEYIAQQRLCSNLAGGSVVFIIILGARNLWLMLVVSLDKLLVCFIPAFEYITTKELVHFEIGEQSTWRAFCDCFAANEDTVRD